MVGMEEQWQNQTQIRHQIRGKLEPAAKDRKTSSGQTRHPRCTKGKLYRELRASLETEEGSAPSPNQSSLGHRTQSFSRYPLSFNYKPGTVLEAGQMRGANQSQLPLSGSLDSRRMGLTTKR